MKPFRWILSLAIVTQTLLPVSGGTRSTGDPTDDKYMYVLDLVFPNNWRNQCVTPNALSFGAYQVTIRIRPGLSQESQIFFCRADNGETFALNSTLDPKDGMVWAPIISEEGKSASLRETPDKIASRFHVLHESCKIPAATVTGWFRKLATVRMDLPKAGGGGADETAYEVTLVHGGDTMSAPMWVPEKPTPLTALVDRIQAEIKKADCIRFQGSPSGH